MLKKEGGYRFYIIIPIKGPAGFIKTSILIMHISNKQRVNNIRLLAIARAYILAITSSYLLLNISRRVKLGNN